MDEHSIPGRRSSVLADALRAAREELGSAENVARVARVRTELSTRLPLLGSSGTHTGDHARERSALQSRHVQALKAKAGVLGLTCLITLGAIAFFGLRSAREKPPPWETPTPATPRAPALLPQPIEREATTRASEPVAPEPSVPQPLAAKQGSSPLARRRAATALPAGGTITPPRDAREAELSEIQLITEAQTLLDTRPQAALQLLQEHATRFPRGMLVEEREILRVDAELALGQQAVAHEHARAFVQRFPRSSQTRRFSTLLREYGTDRKPSPLPTPTE